ncbi:thioredoxin family protein [Leptolyngbya ohadii]|uniref:thioredoxin family protein n=1 Tax=Leptolyngbya ohadii TaxID=1962290 RepID=UPI000B59A0B8|nr:thioredoxin family protein [Leptolyngbya ohadii]
MTATPSSPTPQSNPANRIRNLVILLVAIVLSLSIFLGVRFGSETGTLAAMAGTATPLDVALKNEQPTLIEFYADWCTSCQAMAKDMSDLKDEFGDRINFVMLNVDNTKWLPEMLSYRVDGIPHFVFLDPQGETIASTIGEQPRTVMAANLEALSSGSPLPYLQTRGRVSDFEAPASPKSQVDDPRGHGSQVKG